MNRARYIIYLFIFLLAVILYFQSFHSNPKKDSNVQQDNESKPGVILMDVTGDIKKISQSSSELQFVKDSDKIYQGESILSANNSSVFLFFPSETSIKIYPNTELSIRRLSYEKEGNIDELSLKRGVITIKSSKRKGNDHFTILTPSLIIGVRGLEAKVEVNPLISGKEITRVISFEGTTYVTQHKDGIPLTAEPVCILSKDEISIEEGFGGNIDKSGFDFNEYLQDTQNKYNYTEFDLLKLYHRVEIDKVIMKDGVGYRGLIIGMNEEFLYLHTLDSYKKLPKNLVKVLDTEKLKNN